jgi:fructose-bisphosphate aldolase class II
MSLIVDRNEVTELYAEAAENKWVLPAFNAENLVSTEAILAATKDYGEKIGKDDLPIIIGITVNYSFRSQAVLYSQARQWELGLKLFMSDLKLLCGEGSPYSKIRAMVLLDHVEWDINQEFIDAWDMKQFSSIMFDASNVDFDENIVKTAEFVKKFKNEIYIEGACDEIGKSGTSYTTPDMADRYDRETGVDILVANLGTEHRADAATLKYQDEIARNITKKIGGKLCLHGTSSVSSDNLKDLFHDGIRKVNIWTALERDTTPVLFRDMVENAAKVVGPKNAQEMANAALLGEKADVSSALSLDYFTTTYRQKLIFENMKRVMSEYFEIWYK